LAAFAGIAALALAWRLADLNDPTDNYDEGAYLSALFLMRHGFRPFVEINTGEGPLNLYLSFVPYALGGFTLEAARAGTALISMIGIVGVVCAGRSIAGPVAGLAAGFILAISPSYLRVSRWVGPEAGAIAVAALAVAMALLACSTDRIRFRLLSGALFAVANLIQGSVVMAAVPVLLMTVRRSAPRTVLVAPLAALGVVTVVLGVVGPAEVFGRIVGWRAGGGQFSATWETVAANGSMLLDKMFRQEQPALYALAGVGAIAAFRRAPRVGAALLGWLVAQLALLLVYTELSSHLGTTLLGPLAVLAGLGFAEVPSLAQRRSRALPMLAAGAALWYLTAIPSLLFRDRQLVANELPMERDIGRDEHAVIRQLGRLSSADEFVLTDQPYLAFLADRMVPPDLVDPSTSRINAGNLTGERAVASLRQHDVRVVVLWSDKLVRLEPLMALLASDFERVSRYGSANDESPRAVYRRR
jgi:4-amino-4-deoxy-L-arabinose transferase-like glycosyltransferase